MELYKLLRSILKRVEVIEKKLGLNVPPSAPCSYCNVLGAHQPWCESNAERSPRT